MQILRNGAPVVHSCNKGGSAADDHHSPSRASDADIDSAFLAAETDISLSIRSHERDEDVLPLTALKTVAGADGEAEFPFRRELTLQ